MIKAGGSIRGPSAAVMALSWKDRGVTATTVPDGELKALYYTARHVLNMRDVAESCHNPQPPTTMDQDNQTVQIACRLAGSEKAFIHRRAELGALASMIAAEKIQVVTIPASQQTADIQTKALRPVQHWRSIAWILGQSPALEKCRTFVFNRWSRNVHKDCLTVEEAHRVVEDTDAACVWRQKPPGAHLASASRAAIQRQIPYDTASQAIDALCDSMNGCGMDSTATDVLIKAAMEEARKLERTSPFFDESSAMFELLRAEVVENRSRQVTGRARSAFEKKAKAEERLRIQAEEHSAAARRNRGGKASTLYQSFVKASTERAQTQGREQELKTILLKRKREEQYKAEAADIQTRGAGTAAAAVPAVEETAEQAAAEESTRARQLANPRPGVASGTQQHTKPQKQEQRRGGRNKRGRTDRRKAWHVLHNK